MSVSSGTTLISPTNTMSANDPGGGGGHGPAASVSGASVHSSQTGNPHRKHTRTTSQHAVHHGHGTHGHHAHAHTRRHHGHAMHSSHSSHSVHTSRSSRRSSEGEHGRRALAAGLTMHILDDKPKSKRKTSEPHTAHTSHHTHAHHSRVSSGHPKPSRSDTHLPRLADSPGSSTISQPSDRPHPHPNKRKSEEVVEVIAGSGGNADGDADDGEWESGEETPAGGSKKVEPMRPPPLQTVSEKPAVRRSRSSASGLVESPTDLPTPSPGHEPRETQRTTGFPGVPLTPSSQPSGTVSNTSAGSRPASVLALSRPGSHANLRNLGSGTRTPSTAPVSGVSTGLHTGDLASGTSSRDAQGFPFPPMTPNAGPNGPNGPSQEMAPDANATGDRHLPAKKSPQSTKAAPSPLKPTHQRVASTSSPLTAPLLRRPQSRASLRSVQSLRAPPHPLNSTGGLDSPKMSRAVSLHYPPAAPAVVNRETVEGLGWDGEGSPPARLPEPSEPRATRLGSFSSVRSLKDILGAGPTPAHHPTRRVTSAATPSMPRRLTAMQAATAVSRLGTTSDPVAYHQSLGFSPTTAETAHLLSRFLPPKRRRRPRWAITAREALAAHHALEAGEEPPEPGRIGLTDGQYRDAHESLVASLRSLKTGQARRNAPRSYSYHSLLGATEDISISGGAQRRREGMGLSPFELSVGRCTAQRPRV